MKSAACMVSGGSDIGTYWVTSVTGEERIAPAAFLSRELRIRFERALGSRCAIVAYETIPCVGMALTYDEMREVLRADAALEAEENRRAERKAWMD